MKKQEKIINYQLLWRKIGYYAKVVGWGSCRPVLLLYYVLKSPNTPKAEKVLIISALSYLILPIDLLSLKRLPIIGMVDEIVSLAVAYQKVCKYITPDMEAKVDSILDEWFSEYADYEVIPK